MAKTKSRANGDGDMFPRKNAAGKITSYRGAYFGPDGRRRYVSGKTKEEARKALREARAGADAGLVFDAGNLKLSGYLRRWLNDSVRGSVAPITHESYERLVNKHVVPALGNVKLSKLTPAHLQGFYRTKLDAGLSPRTVQYLHVVLHRALKQALRWSFVTRNVAEAVDPPKVHNKEVTPLSPEQARVFLEAASEAGDRLEALYMLAIHTGMRQGELLALRWEDVDLDAGVLRVKGTKTARSRRTVKLSETALEALRSHLTRQLGEIRPGRVHVAGKRPCIRHEDRNATQPAEPYAAFFQAIAEAGGFAGDTFSRPSAHMRYDLALEGCTRQVCAGASRPRHHSHHPGHLQPRATRHGQRDGRRYGRGPTLAVLLPHCCHAPVFVRRGYFVL